MRPLALTIDGLRSYRHPVTVDFTDRDLVAIIGDTGAGKSSLLEGLCVALYNACTWHKGSAKPLIADGCDALRVELTFRADEAVWRVTRAIFRKNYPPALHNLECLTDGRTFDSETAVNQEIRRLVGLEFDGFLKAVVLPQGRFQVLLQSGQADRTAILKNILRVDQLGVVREQAIALGQEFRPRLGELQTQRAALLADPATAAAEAQAAAHAGREQLGRLEEVKTRLRDEEQKAATAQAAAIAWRAHASRLHQIGDLGPAVQQLRDLVKVDGELVASIESANAEVARLASREAQLVGAVGALDADGVGPAGIAAARATLGGVAAQLDRLRAQAEQHATEQDQLVAARAACAELDAQARTVEAAAGAARAALAALEATTTKARGRVELARQSLGAARAALEARRQAEADLANARETDERARDTAERARESQRVALARAETAEKAFEALRRTNAATHAAQGCAPGDHCPVCARELPAGFVPPPLTGDDDAVVARDAAAADAARTTATLAGANANAKHAAGARTEAGAKLERAQSLWVAASRALAEHLAAGGPPVDVDESVVVAPDDAVLGPLESAAANAEAALVESRKDVEARQAEATTAAARVRHEHERVAERERALAAAQSAARQHEAELEQALGTLPAAFRPPPPVTPATIAAALAAVDRAAEVAATSQRDLDACRAELASAHAKLREIADRRAREVEAPLMAGRRAFDEMVHPVNEALAALAEPALATRPDEPISALGDWAEETAVRVGSALEACSSLAAAHADAARNAAANATAVLVGAGVATSAELDQLVVAAAADTRRAEQDHARAVAQIPVAAELDGRLSQAVPVLAALEELARLLADGKFVTAVVRRKQRALLAVASELLDEMSAGRFGFADDFLIVDRLSGQPRDTKTLSGGETFLASLALALALVELAGRGGGRLEALFLDEGFGSLDANVLGDALDVLSRQAEGGRLVAVISHLRAVAENLEHVLLVTKGAGGSDTRWLPGDERDRLVSDEAAGGLLV